MKLCDRAPDSQRRFAKSLARNSARIDPRAADFVVLSIRATDSPRLLMWQRQIGIAAPKLGFTVLHRLGAPRSPTIEAGGTFLWQLPQRIRMF